MWHNVVSTVRKNTLPFKSLRSVSFYFGKSLKLTKPITPVFSVPWSFSKYWNMLICCFLLLSMLEMFFSVWLILECFDIPTLFIFLWTHESQGKLGDLKGSGRAQGRRGTSLHPSVFSLFSRISVVMVTLHQNPLLWCWHNYVTKSNVLALEKQIDSKWFRLRHFHWIMQPISLYFLI